MAQDIILASTSEIRRHLLDKAGVKCGVVPARVDEETVKSALLAEQAKPRDIADALAELKALKISRKHPQALVIGCDQVLSVDRQLLSKPETLENARSQLMQLRGRQHELLSAAVICEDGRPVWRHVGVVRMEMREFSDSYLDAYLQRNWDSIRDSVGGYKLEEEGVRFFTRVQGDYFTVLGLPLLEMLNYLTLRGDLAQ